MMEVGGLFFDFEPIRTTSGAVAAAWSHEDAIAATAQPRRGPNRPKLDKETTHELL